MKSKNVSRIKFGLSRIVALFMAAAMLTFGFASCSSDSGDGGDEAKTYFVKVEKAEHGTVVASAEKAEAGKTITLVATAEEGYVFEAYSVKDADGKSVEVKDDAFKMPASDVIVSVSFKKKETIPDTPTDNPQEPDANLTAANAVITKINAIGTVEYTADCNTKIDEARTAYDALTEAQKALVSAETFAVLTNAETTYSTLKVAADNQAAANAVTEKINAIGTVEYTTECKAKIDAARTAYNALTEAQKSLIPAETLAVLTNAETTYDANLFSFKSFTIPAAGISKSGATINATIEADNFANPNIDFSKFTASCSENPSITTGAVFTKVSDTEIKATFKIPGTAGEYSITVSYGSNSKTGTLKVQDYKVGDVLMNDGTIERYSETPSFTDEQKSKAVGVTYALNEYGAPAGWLGIHNSAYRWATNGTTGYTTNFTGIQCTLQGANRAASTATFTGDTDGSDNWTYICSVDPSGSADAATNYPAFDYVNKYATTFSLTGTYAAGWYMPSIAELTYIYRNKTTLNAVLQALGGTQLASELYWSSSQYDSNKSAWSLKFSDGFLYNNDKVRSYRVCCVRAFSN